MGLATFVVGCLPVYDSIGCTGAVPAGACRVVQGLALGGEYGGAATYIAEHAPDGKRGLYTSWIQTTATMGIVAGAAGDPRLPPRHGRRRHSAPMAGASRSCCPRSWSCLSGYIRLRLEELPLFRRLKAQGKASANPALESFSSGHNWGLILIALFGFTAPEGVVWYTGQFYALIYMIAVLKVPYVTVYLIMIFAAARRAVLHLVRLAVRQDRRARHHDAGFALAVITYWPVFTWMGRLQGQSGHALHAGVLHGDPGDDGVRADRRVPGRAVPGADPLHLDVAALSRRQRRVRRPGAGGSAASIAGLSGVPLIGLLYPMGIAALGVVVSLVGLRARTDEIQIWDEVGGAPPLVPDQP